MLCYELPYAFAGATLLTAFGLIITPKCSARQIVWVLLADPVVQCRLVKCVQCQRLGFWKTLLLRFRTAGMRFQNKITKRKWKWRYLLLTCLVMLSFSKLFSHEMWVMHMKCLVYWSCDINLILPTFTSTSRSEVREGGYRLISHGLNFHPPAWKLVGRIFSSWKLWQLGENILTSPDQLSSEKGRIRKCWA